MTGQDVCVVVITRDRRAATLHAVGRPLALPERRAVPPAVEALARRAGVCPPAGTGSPTG